MEKYKKISEELYFRYEYLANKYANKIFSYEQLSFEYEDLLQEFKIKIFSSIKSYGKRWAKYRKNEASRPVPIRFYLEAACSNKMRDFIKYISRENYKTRIDDISYDYGIEIDSESVLPENNKFFVNGIDLLEGLVGKERIIFSLFLRGYNNKILTKVYFNKEDKNARKKIIESGDEVIEVSDIIEMQKKFLITKYGNELTQQKTIYSSYSFDD